MRWHHRLLSSQLTKWLILEQEPHLHAAPCRLWEHVPQGQPFPWVDTPPTTAEDLPVAMALRLNDEAGANAAALPMAETAERVEAARRTILFCSDNDCNGSTSGEGVK